MAARGVAVEVVDADDERRVGMEVDVVVGRVVGAVGAGVPAVDTEAGLVGAEANTASPPARTSALPAAAPPATTRARRAG